MNYVIAAIAGLAFGAGGGLIKYLLLWRPLLTNKKDFNQKRLITIQIFSMLINIAILIGVFLLRKIWPYPFEITIISTAIGLSIISRLSPLKDIKHIEKLKQENASKTTADDQGNPLKIDAR